MEHLKTLRYKTGIGGMRFIKDPDAFPSESSGEMGDGELSAISESESELSSPSSSGKDKLCGEWVRRGRAVPSEDSGLYSSATD
jgi:hypothetical protein